MTNEPKLAKMLEETILSLPQPTKEKIEQAMFESMVFGEASLLITEDEIKNIQLRERE